MPKRAFASFAFEGVDGMAVVVREDDIYADDDPIVVRYPGNFQDLADAVTTRSHLGVEQATAAPGEVRRGPGRPRNFE